jgi:hypothetical protein
MKGYILSTVAAGAFLLVPAFAQQAPPSGSSQGDDQRFEDHQAIQRQRIRDGVKSGQLTPEQGRKLMRQSRDINREAAAMNKRTNGNLNAGQKRQIARQMNNQSRHIYTAKHK